MGLYDILRCHYPLPVPGANAREYQTKSTWDPCMRRYEITPEGVLRLSRTIPPKELGSWRDCVEFTGWLEFYDDALTFIAFFRDGVMRAVLDITPSLTPGENHG